MQPGQYRPVYPSEIEAMLKGETEPVKKRKVSW
jgi:23S rRNA pseudouridine2605 synthase